MLTLQWQDRSVEATLYIGHFCVEVIDNSVEISPGTGRAEFALEFVVGRRSIPVRAIVAHPLHHLAALFDLTPSEAVGEEPRDTDLEVEIQCDVAYDRGDDGPLCLPELGRFVRVQSERRCVPAGLREGSLVGVGFE